MIASLLLSALTVLQGGPEQPGAQRPGGQAPTAPALAGPKTLSLALLDEQGEVPQGMVVRFHAYVGEEVIGGFFEVPENGRMLLEVPQQLRRMTCTRVAVIPSEMNSPIGDWSRAGILEVPEEQAGLELDLGELRLGNAPVMYAGRVVDDRGEPVVGAQVIVDSQKFNGGPDTAELFETLLITAATDEEGRFLIRGRPGWSGQELALRIAAKAEGHQEATGTLVEPPSEDLELLLPRAGSATVSWILPRMAEGVSMGVQLLPMDADPAEALLYRWPRRELPFPKLAPGLYRLLLVDDGGNVIHEVEGIEIHPGEVCADERIRDIDLSERVKVVRLTVIEEAGRVLQVPFNVWGVEPRDGRHPRAGWRGTTREEWWLMLGKGMSADVYVSARGYRPQPLEGVDNDQVVRMRRSLQLTLQVVGTDVYEKDGRFLGLAMLAYPVAQPGDPLRPGYSAELVGAGPVRGPRVEASLPGPGEYLVRWNVYERLPDGRPNFIGALDGDLLEITEEMDQGSIETPLPPEVWTLEKSD